MKPYTCGPSVSEATIIGATDSWAWTQSVHVFTEPRPGTHMLPAKAVHEFTRTNRKSSVKSGEEGRGCGGPGEEFRVDFHSAVPAALNLQRGRERGRKRERERRENAVWTLLCRKGFCLRSRRSCLCLWNVHQTWVVFRLTEARWEPRGVVGDAAHYALRPTSLRTDLSRVSSTYNLVRIWSPLNYPERTAKTAGDSSVAATETVTPDQGLQELDSPPPNMSSQAKVKKDKEIIAEYETQVKGGWRAGLLSLLFCMWGHTIA